MSLDHAQIGLCKSCKNAQIVRNRRGSTFYLCKLSEQDPRFPKYPRLPVLACDGHEPQAGPNASDGPQPNPAKPEPKRQNH